MVVLPLKPSFEELRLTVSSAEMVLPGLNLDEEIVFACEISSLPNHNCNVIFRTAKVRNEVTDSAIEQFLYEINKIRDEEVGAEELQNAKN